MINLKDIPQVYVSDIDEHFSVSLMNYDGEFALHIDSTWGHIGMYIGRKE